MSRALWLDCSTGAAGDMLLAALVGAGADLRVVQESVAGLGVGATIDVNSTLSGGLAARQVTVNVSEVSPPTRTLSDVLQVLSDSALADDVRALAVRVFTTLAQAEAVVHGTGVDEVHFHEVGAHDALADVVGVCAAVVSLGVDTVVAGSRALGGGTARTEHGSIPVPVPAVLELLAEQGIPASGGPVDVELCTPTGAALLVTVADSWGAMPAMTVDRVGLGAGRRELPGRPNVVRAVVGQLAPAGALGPRHGDDGEATSSVVLECNVDDLDPRLWPRVLDQLLAAGASDAWLTPILMKKGRPAHTLSVLVPDDPALLQALRDVVFRETTTIGLREHPVAKRALQRRERTVLVHGQRVRVKEALLDGQVVNAQPEWEDVLAAAQALDVPAKALLQQLSSERELETGGLQQREHGHDDAHR
ncbi:MAG: nickel pincer cofactor biosynthesis protein LarC [Actinomycetales bacterium]